MVDEGGDTQGRKPPGITAKLRLEIQLHIFGQCQRIGARVLLCGARHLDEQDPPGPVARACAAKRRRTAGIKRAKFVPRAPLADDDGIGHRGHTNVGQIDPGLADLLQSQRKIGQAGALRIDQDAADFGGAGRPRLRDQPQIRRQSQRQLVHHLVKQRRPKARTQVFGVFQPQHQHQPRPAPPVCPTIDPPCQAGGRRTVSVRHIPFQNQVP